MSKRLHKLLTKKFLIKEYINNKKSSCKIAKENDCNWFTVINYLNKYNIPIRSRIEAQKGRHVEKKNSGYIDGRCLNKYYCIDCGRKIHYATWKYGSKNCRSCSSKRDWKKEEYRDKVVRTSLQKCSLKPNKPEKSLNKLLNKLLPKEYKYVGNGKIILGGFNPDFININGQKKIIELYGDYWHNLPSWKERDKRRLITYKKLGYKTLIIWQHELKDLTKLKEKLNAF